MADSKVSDLTEATNIGTSDDFYVAQNGVSKKVKIGKIAQGIKLTNIEIPGIGFQYNANADPGYINIYDSNSNLDPLIQIDNLGIRVRTNVSQSGSTYALFSLNEMQQVGNFFNHDSDDTDIQTTDSAILVKDKTTNNHAYYGADGLDYYYDGGVSNLSFPISQLLKLRELVPDGSGKLKSDDGYYINSSAKKPEAMVVELYQIDQETMEPSDTLVQGAKYRSDAIEFYDANGNISLTKGLDLAPLDGLKSYTNSLVSLLQDLDTRITALENA